MPTVEGLYSYPLSGARPVELQEAVLTSSRLPHDRLFVGYDTSSVKPNGGFARVSIKKSPMLATVDVSFDPQENALRMAAGDLQHTVAADQIDHALLDQTVYVDEFKDRVPCTDMGDDAAAFMASVTGVETARLARKEADWVNDHPHHPDPIDRNNASVHIVNRATHDELHRRGLAEHVGIERMRAGVVASGLEPFQEEALIGEYALDFGPALLHVDRLAPRCPAPNTNEQGVRGDDFAEVYKTVKHQFGRAELPVIGVYGRFEQKNADTPAIIHAGQSFQIVRV